jgi:hypothetical protein
MILIPPARRARAFAIFDISEGNFRADFVLLGGLGTV